MNLIFRKFSTKTQFVLTIIKLFHGSKDIKCKHKNKEAFDYLEINKDQIIYGPLAIVQYLAQKRLDFTAYDSYWWFCYNFKETKDSLSTVPSQNLQKLNDLLENKAFIGGHQYGEIDVLAYLKINKFVNDLPFTLAKYSQLIQWYGYMKNLVDPIIKQLESEFPFAVQQFAAKKNKNQQSSAGSTEKGEKQKKPQQQQQQQQQPQQSSQAQDKPKGKFPKKVEEKDEYTIKFNAIKLKRLNEGQEILPQPGQRNILITSALPYVNNVPHLGNIVGCVLGADVFARFCRLRGYNTVYMCGTDEYGTATEMKARQEKTTPQEICNKYWKIHHDVYKYFDIDFDKFGRTSTPLHTKIAQDIFTRLNNNGYVLQDTMEQCFCQKCDTFLADRYVTGTCPHCQFTDAKGDQCDKCGKLLNPLELISSKCELCKTPPVVKQTKHCYLDLPKLQPKLEEWIKQSSVKGYWTENAISTSWSWCNQGLKPRCISRDLKWGTPVPLPGWESKVMYVWFDAPIGYPSITNNYTKEWEKWWKNPKEVQLFQFMAKDNIPFHTVVFPASLIGTGEPWTLLHHINSCEYLNYEDGKFSKSRGIGVFGDDAGKTDIPVEVWRYYLLVNRPEKQDTVFTWNDFGDKNNNELLPNLGNLCQRSLKFCFSNYKEVVPEFKMTDLIDRDKKFLQDVWQSFQTYLTQFEKVEIKQCLKLAMDISSMGNKYMQDEKPWEKQQIASGRSIVVISVIINFIRFLSCIFEPFMPSLSAKINFILGFTERTQKDEVLLSELVKINDPEKAILSLVPPKQKLNRPVTLFREISPEELEQLKQRFAGQQK